MKSKAVPSCSSTRRRRRKGTGGALGVVLGETLPYAFEDPQAARFLAGIAGVCAEHRLAMTILPSNGSADDSQRIRAAAVDGFVVWTTTDDDPVLEALSLTGKPVIVHAGPALGALQAVEARGLAVPRQLALTGWDASVAGTAKGLTSVYQDLREQGAAAARAAIQGLPESDWKAWKVVRGQTTA